MAADNKLGLVIEVRADKANAQIKGPTQSLAGIERIAVSVAKNASEGIGGMTASIAKGALAGNLLAEAIRDVAIGGAIGFGAGLIRLFVKGATEKAREKIRAAYGVDVKDKAVLHGVPATRPPRRTSWGGGDRGHREASVCRRHRHGHPVHGGPGPHPVVRDGHRPNGQRDAGVRRGGSPVTLGQTGGSLYRIPGHSNGSPLPSPGGLLASRGPRDALFASWGGSMGLDRLGAGLASNAGPLVIQLNGPATTSLLNGVAVKAVASNPRTVQAATLAATKANAGRRAMTALQVSPGTITA